MSANSIKSDSSNEGIQRGKRPGCVSAFVILGLISFLQAIYQHVSYYRSNFEWIVMPGIILPAELFFIPLIITLIPAVMYVGLWKMKKWGAFLYAAIVVVNQVVLIAMSVWSPLALIIPAIVVIIAFVNLPKMT